MGNQVLCEAFIPDKTEGGLIIPIESRKKTRIMTVVRKGPTCESVKEGDKVILGDTSRVVELKFGTIDYIQVPEFALIGFVRNTKT
jgi:co-chaperonin GroES (HSP10)